MFFLRHHVIVLTISIVVIAVIAVMATDLDGRWFRIFRLDALDGCAVSVQRGLNSQDIFLGVLFTLAIPKLAQRITDITVEAGFLEPCRLS